MLGSIREGRFPRSRKQNLNVLTSRSGFYLWNHLLDTLALYIMNSGLLQLVCVYVCVSVCACPFKREDGITDVLL